MQSGSREDAIKAALMARAQVAVPIAGDTQSGMGETHFGDCPLGREPQRDPSTAVRVRHAKCIIAGAILAAL